MRRIFGILVLAISAVAGVVLLATGSLGSSRVVNDVSWNMGSVHLTVTDVAFDPNWWLVATLAVCASGGLLCVVLPRRR